MHIMSLVFNTEAYAIEPQSIIMIHELPHVHPSPVIHVNQLFIRFHVLDKYTMQNTPIYLFETQLITFVMNSHTPFIHLVVNYGDVYINTVLSIEIIVSLYGL